MTVPSERTNAVIRTEAFLIDLLDPKKTPRIPKAIRLQAHSLLRHYPTQFEMDVIADREDGNNEPLKMKIFGKGFV